jgi:glutamyl-tRNA synthetase
MLEDLHWFGFQWQEGPDVGGPYAPYSQSQRLDMYRAVFEKLRAGGFVYPCLCSRKDVLRALQAPHVGEDEPMYPGTCRPSTGKSGQHDQTAGVNWRFQVPDGQAISFIDGRSGLHEFLAGRDFGDFVIWRHDDLPSYQLAVVVDDAAMAITEVVRGEDLLKSTARQLLLYKALSQTPPSFYHCPLVTDEAGVRLAKRHDSLGLRTLRASGAAPETIRAGWGP